MYQGRNRNRNRQSLYPAWRDGGVYAELEAIVLSRDVPAYIRWLVNSIGSRLSRNSILTSLEQTREAVRKRQFKSHCDYGLRIPSPRNECGE